MLIPCYLSPAHNQAMNILPLLLASLLAACAATNTFFDEAFADEASLNAAFARSIGGQTEVTHVYTVQGRRHTVRVDIETDSHVIEGGLDKRSSLDSVQQAVFAAKISGKKPKIVIYDHDGTEGQFEYRIRIAANSLGVAFERIPVSRLRP